VHEFDGRKRTCTARLAHHNTRRRERHQSRAKERAAGACGSSGASGADGADAGEGAAATAAPPPRTSKRAAALRAAAVIARHGRDADMEDSEDDASNSGVDASSDADVADAQTAGAARSFAPPPVAPGEALTQASAWCDAALRNALFEGAFDLGDWFHFEPAAPAQPPALAPALAPITFAPSPPLPPPAAALPAGAWWLQHPGSAASSMADAVAAADAAAAVHPATMHVKLPAASPFRLPLGLPAAFASVFAASAAAAATAAGGGAPAALCAALRPGCVLLSVDALLDEEGTDADEGGDAGADALVARLLAAPGPAGDFFRRQPSFSVHAPGSRAPCAAAGAAGGAPVVAALPPSAPRLPPLAPLASLSTASVTVTPARGAAAAAAAALHGAQLHCRLNGVALALAPQAELPPGALAQLCAAGAEGVALFEAAPSAECGHRAGAPRPLLLCRDAAIVAEVCTMAPECAAADADAEESQRDAAERIVAALGAALCADASLTALAAAAAAAVTLGWGATTARLLPALREAALRAAGPRGDAAALCRRGGVPLLHRAVAAGHVHVARLLLRHGGQEGLFGAPATRGPAGVTPLHIAAATPASDGGAMAAMMLDASAVGPAIAGDALWAWYRCVASDGHTPAHLAAAAAAALSADGLPPATRTMAAQLVRRSVVLRERRDASAAAARALILELEEDGHVAPQLQPLAALDALALRTDAASCDAAALFRAAVAAMDAAQSRTPPSAVDAAAPIVATASQGVATRGQAYDLGMPASQARNAEAAAAEALEADFLACQRARGRQLWGVLTALWFSKSVANMVHAWWHVLSPGSTAGAWALAQRNVRLFTFSTKLNDPLTGTPVQFADLEWEVMRNGSRRLALVTLLVRMPVSALALALTVVPRLWVWAAPRYEPIFLAVCCIESIVYAWIDWIVYDTSGFMVEWPGKVLVLRALILAASFYVGPFRSRANRIGWVVRAVAGSGVAMLAHPRLRHRLWANLGYRVHGFALIAEALLESANQARLRRRHAAQAAAQVAACKKRA
jgi:hypothetical protein